MVIRMSITMFDVPPSELIKRLAEKFKEDPYIKPPEWAKFVKTGSFKKTPPQQEDWWYLRAASVLYQVSRRGPIGLGKLRYLYGGRKSGHNRPEHKAIASGKIIRLILQQLELSNYVVKTVKGRTISPRGQKLLTEIAKEIAKEKGILQ